MGLTRVSEVPALPLRPNDAHKGTFGTVIVVGGAMPMPGAAALCAGSALRGGAGLVKIATDDQALLVALAVEPSATGIVLSGHLEDDVAQLEAADAEARAVLAVGPGLGTQREKAALVTALWRGRRAMVIDADALNILAKSEVTSRQDDGPTVLTPHPGEFARLASACGITHSATDPATRPQAASALARQYRAIIVLKGAHTIVSDGDRFYQNEAANAALATAGTGDVLTGLIASLMAQRMDAFEAAVLGVHLHALAGELWQSEYGPGGLTARDLIARLPQAFQMHRQRG